MERNSSGLGRFNFGQNCRRDWAADQIEAFTQACPYIVVAQKEGDADAILHMNHQHGSGGTDSYRWNIAVGDKQIDDAGRKVAVVRDHACRRHSVALKNSGGVY